MGQLGADGQPGLAGPGRLQQRARQRDPTGLARLDRQGVEADGGVGDAVDLAHADEAEAGGRGECWRLRTVSVEPAHSSRTGAFTALHSASPGVAVPSGSTIPSMTKLPSCTTSPKSPPYA